MNLQEKKTWQTLQNLAIDDKCAFFKFSDRLARENGWSKKFALQCIEEYKKFVFLAKHAGHPVTPSLEVDEAWHLHMIYTRSYWEEMCKEIEFQLHHGPTKGGKAEDVKFTDWYAKTKDSYRKFFGEPPSAFWPSSEIRFSPQDVVKVNRKNFFLFKKPKLKLSNNYLSFLPLSILLSFLSDNIYWIIGGIVLWLIVALIVRWVKRNNRNGGSGSSSSCSSSSSSGCGGLGWVIFSCSSGCSSHSSGCSSGSSGCSSGSSGCSSGSSGCSSGSSGCSSGSSGCGSSCGGGCGS